MKAAAMIAAIGCLCVTAAGQQLASTSKFQTTADAFQPDTFVSRRARLSTAVADGLVVLFGEKNPGDAWDEHVNDPLFRLGPFKQEENFFYLTGLGFPDLTLVIDPAAGRTTIYAPIAPAAAGRADGSAELRAEMKRLGLRDPLPMAQLESDLQSQIRARPVYVLARTDTQMSNAPKKYAPFLPGAAPDSLREDVTRRSFERRYPGVTVKSIVPAMTALKKVLDADEIAAMKRVVGITVLGFKRGIAHVAPGVDDREIAAEMEYAYKKNGAQSAGYGADLQSGPNGFRGFLDLFASYDLRNRTMRAGEVALLDHGAEANYYIADLARTVPVSGRFTADQRLAYETYMIAYEAGLAAIKPGVPYGEVSRVAAKALEARLPALPAWLKEPATKFATSFAAGHPGHFIGLNLNPHEDYTSPLVPGQVVAYESALMIPDRGWRFTTEDNVLITATGHEVLSSDLPRTADGVERMMAQRAKAGRE